jgi:hypothetical protein
MTKIRSREECLNAIQEDSAWRKREMTVMKSYLVLFDEHDQGPLLRSAAVMIYAHWEGFVRTASEAYFSYVNELIARRHVSLSSHFTDLLMWKMFRKKGGGHDSARNPVPFLQMRREWPCGPDEQLPADVIDTESNLTSKVLKGLAATVGIEYTPFLTKEKLIDEHLLKLRNEIAHGRRVAVQREEYEAIEHETRQLIDCFQDLIETCVQRRVYSRPDGSGTD